MQGMHGYLGATIRKQHFSEYAAPCSPLFPSSLPSVLLKHDQGLSEENGTCMALDICKRPCLH